MNKRINIEMRNWGGLCVNLCTVFACWKRRNLGFQCRAWESLLCMANPLNQGVSVCVWGGAIGGRVGAATKNIIVMV